MAIYVALFLCSLLIAWLFTPVLRKAAVKNGFLDYPDERRVHKDAVPRIGGIAIAVSFFISVMLGYALLYHKLGESAKYLTGLSIGGIVVVILGLGDDLWGMNAWKKMIGQVIAVLTLIPFGFVIRELNIPFLGVIELGTKLGIPFTIFWIVGIINTINFIDGIDGLATGVAFIIASMLFVIAAVTGQLLIGLVCLAIAGSALGFLRHNFNPASIFMGDCGAMFLGLILGAASVKILFQDASMAAGALVPILIFGLPIADTTWCIVRRISRQVSPFSADGRHIHHRLIILGLTQRQTVAILYVAASLSSTAGLVLALAGSEKSAIIVFVSMFVIALIGISILGRAVPFKPTKT